ncbi:hypothetical protein CK203_046974 [Vitis vinifera]|uniref:Retrovirus-related Pol polyprotein from transposon TNT 1-94-like beta-barrel domain-containing protein n=1 Tax=Vitis vinifera TaxID=29760 RepID=A0A438FWM4_VITVI|nr:hypothetical protein CK203_046974 [Vitis vinifera]
MVKTAMISERPTRSSNVISDSSLVNSNGLNKNREEVRGRTLSTKPLHHFKRRVLKSERFMFQILECFFKVNSWIIDSNAFDHMTGDITLFHSYQPCSESYKIKIAYGSYSLVASKGSVILPNSFKLLFVLHVPKLTCKLLSISKVTKI